MSEYGTVLVASWDVNGWRFRLVNRIGERAAILKRAKLGYPPKRSEHLDTFQLSGEALHVWDEFGKLVRQIQSHQSDGSY